MLQNFYRYSQQRRRGSYDKKTFAALFPTVVLSKLLRTYLISALRSRVKNTFRDQFKLESD